MTCRLLPPLALAALLAPLPALAQPEGFVWTYDHYVAANPLDTYLGLAFGIPQSDALQAAMRCAIGADWIYSTVELGLDVEGLADAATVDVVLSANGYSTTEPGTVFRHEEGIWGVELAIGLDSPLWPALAQGGALQYGIAERTPETLPLDGIEAPLHAYLGACQNIGNLPVDDGSQPAGKSFRPRPARG